MKFYSTFTLAVIFAIATALVGCSKTTNSPTSPTSTGTNADITAIQQMVVQNDSVSAYFSSDEATIDDGGAQPPDFGGLIAVTDSSSPVRWGRHIFWNLATRTVTVDTIGDSLAIANVVTTIPGDFVVQMNLGSRDTILQKPFTETERRNVEFVRVGNSDSARFNWRPSAISLVDGMTTPESAQSLDLVSLEFTGATAGGVTLFDTVVTDPLQTYLTYRGGRRANGEIPVISSGEKITLTATVHSTNDSAEVVVLRGGIDDHTARGRTLMTLVSATKDSTGAWTRVYTRMIVARPMPRGILEARYNATVDVTSREAIYDVSAPYNNEYWGAPYIEK